MYKRLPKGGKVNGNLAKISPHRLSAPQSRKRTKGTTPEQLNAMWAIPAGILNQQKFSELSLPNFHRF